MSLRVAFCIDNMNVGGTELNAVRLAERLVERGVDLRVFSLASEGPLLDRYARAGVPVHVLPIQSLYGRSALRQGRELRQLVRRHAVQIVHAHDFYSNIFAGVWTRAAGARFVASRRWWEGPDRRLQRWANRGAYLLADRVLANSEGVAELLIKEERLPRRRVVVVRNFLDDAAFHQPPGDWLAARQRELGLGPGAPVLGCVASLQPIKDHPTLLRAAARLLGRWPELKLVLVGGDRGGRTQVEAVSAALGLNDCVRFAGECPNHPSMHWLFDVAVLPSRSEGLPNSVLEAMAAGRPVVATRVGAVPDAIQHEDTGLLVPPGDDAAMANALAKLLADARLRERLGSAARDAAHRAYSADAAMESLLSLYCELAGVAAVPALASAPVA